VKLAEDPRPCSAVTVSGMVVLTDKVPRLPFKVSAYGPGATLASTLMVTVEEAAVGLVPKVAVMPAGQFDAENSTTE
jgi:hypothetical protein